MKNKTKEFYVLNDYKEYLLANDKDANMIGWTMVKKSVDPKGMSLKDVTKLYVDVQQLYYNSGGSLPKEGRNFRFKVIKNRCKFSKKNRADCLNKLYAERREVGSEVN